MSDAAVSTMPGPSGVAESSPAVRAGDLIEVGGTSAAGEDGRVRYPGDAYLQAKEALAAIGVSLRRLGAGPEDVVRTRIYLKKSWQWAEVGKAHEEFFGGVLPATTFVGAGGFPDPDVLVEIEATAVAGDDRVRLAP